MKRVFALSLSLVAFSGGAGLGLSMLHDYSATMQTAMMTSSEIQSDAVSGFAIPQYVPSIAASATIAPDLPAPAAPAATGLPTFTEQTVADVRPRLRDDAAAALTTQADDTAETQAVPQQQAAKAQTLAYTSRAKARTQAGDTGYRFTPENAPTYMVGVYR